MENLDCPYCSAPLGNEATACGKCGKELNSIEEKPPEERGNNNKIFGILIILLAVLGGVALLLATGLIPNPFKDSSTVAIVNGEKISSAEVDQKLEVYKKIYGKNSPDDFSGPGGEPVLKYMKRQILNALIQEKILLTEARKENISVSPQEIKEKIASIKKTMNLSEKDFEEFLKNHAMSISNFEKRIEKETLITKLIAKGTQEKGLTREAWLREINARAKVEIIEP
jgi:hypothetical protein